jgi:hypothetical protein
MMSTRPQTEVVEANYRNACGSHGPLYLLGELPNILNWKKPIVTAHTRGKNMFLNGSHCRCNFW